MLAANKPHWLVVVRPGWPELYVKLRRRFAGSPLVEVLVDRRRGDRRRTSARVPDDRRRTDRRRPPVPRGVAAPGGYRLVEQADGFKVLQAEARVPTQCPDCGALLEFEMPRFTELPARLEIQAIHGARAQHYVEAQAFRVSGRPFLACRMVARRRLDGMSDSSDPPEPHAARSSVD